MKALSKVVLFIVFCSYVQIVHATKQYDFVSSLVESLNLARIARDRLNSDLQKENDLISLMRPYITFREEIRRASSPLSGYVKSDNEFIREPVQIIVKTYNSLSVDSGSMVKLIEGMLNDPEKMSKKIGTHARRISEIQSSMDESWRLIPQVTVLSTYALVDLQHKGFLHITKEEREALITKLENIFGKSTKTKDGTFAVEVSGKLLLKFLRNDEWKTSK